MGSWNTLHFFDHNLFLNEVVPALKGTGTSIKEEYKGFSRRFRTGSIVDFTKEELENYLNDGIKNIHSIAREFNHDFSNHQSYSSLGWNNQRAFLDDLPFYYEFNAFFEYYVFSSCANFFPHLPTGKHGLGSRIDCKKGSAANDIIDQLDNMNTFHCVDGNGIVNWLTSDYTKLLWMSRKDLIAKNEDEEFLTLFFRMLEIANSTNLGIIRGVDLRESALEELPSFKLVSEEEWL